MRVLALLMLCVLAGLSFAGAPDLRSRVLTTDGDMKTVALWRWLNDLTGDRAAVVLTAPNDLADIQVPRAWKKGQTVGEVVRAAEIFLGRFRVIFEGDSVTLRSMTADELLRRGDYRKAIHYDDWESSYEKLKTGFWIHAYMPLLVSNVDTVKTMFGGGAGIVFRLWRNSLSGLVRVEVAGAEQPDYVSRSTMRTLALGLRWNTAWFGPLGLYMQGAVTGSWFSGPSEDLAAGIRDWSGPGVYGGGGFNWWFNDHVRLFTEVGFSSTWLRHTAEALTHTEIRWGVEYGL